MFIILMPSLKDNLSLIKIFQKERNKQRERRGMMFPTLIRLNDTLYFKAFVPNLAQEGYVWL
jgi:hypothetical protein